MPSVRGSRKMSAASLHPTAKPKKMVVILINAFCAVSLKRDTTPHSRIRLPKQNIPNKRSEEHTSELQSRGHLVCRLLLEKKKRNKLIIVGIKLIAEIPPQDILCCVEQHCS